MHAERQPDRDAEVAVQYDEGALAGALGCRERVMETTGAVRPQAVAAWELDGAEKVVGGELTGVGDEHLAHRPPVSDRPGHGLFETERLR